MEKVKNSIVENESKEELNEKESTVTTEISPEGKKTGIVFKDAFENKRNPTEDSDDTDIERGNNSIIFKTNVPVSHSVSEDNKTGRVYHNLSISWIQTVVRNGKSFERDFEVRFSPKNSSNYGISKLYDLLDIICLDLESIPLEVVKREGTDNNNRKTVSYSARVSCLDDEGVEFACPLKPSTDGDKANFEVLINFLKKNGDIS